MGVVSAKTPPPRVPFRQAARRRFARLLVNQGGTFAGGAGSAWNIVLPAVGYLESIYLHVSGLVNCAAGSTLTFGGPWNILRLIQVRVNVGSAILYSTNGWNNFLVQSRLRRSSRPDDATAAAGNYAAGVAVGDNQWDLTFVIPVAANWHRQFGVGLINLQAPEIQVTCEGTWGATADVAAVGAGTGIAAATALTAAYGYYDVPDPRAVQQPPAVVHRIIQSDQVITAAGDQTYTLPREGMLYRLHHNVIQNDARYNVANQFRLVANRTDEIYRYTNRWEMLESDVLNFGRAMPTGYYGYELWGADGEPAEGDARDMIDAEKLSTLESIFNVAAAPAGTINRIESVREFAQVLR